MHQQGLQLIIRQKLHDGTLPTNSIPRVWGGPGNGEACDACDGTITKDEWVIEGISLAEGRKPLQLHAESASTSGSASGTPWPARPSLPSAPKTTAPMADEGQAPDPRGPEGSSFTIVGRVTHWKPIARELTIGGRVIRVAASVLFVGNLFVGASIRASGHRPPDPSAQWVVTHLRVG